MLPSDEPTETSLDPPNEGGPEGSRLVAESPTGDEPAATLADSSKLTLGREELTVLDGSGSTIEAARPIDPLSTVDEQGHSSPSDTTPEVEPTVNPARYLGDYEIFSEVARGGLDVHGPRAGPFNSRD